MRKRFWKIEYSITIFVIFAVVMLLIPSKFIASKEAAYISKWNEIYTRMEYIFTAMHAQEDSDIVKSFKRAKSDDKREKIMMNLVKPYLRISEQDELNKKYTPDYMNGQRVMVGDVYYFESFYLTNDNEIIGIKDIKDDDIFHPAFLMMFDMNGLNGPNVWGKDIFGLNIFLDGKINPVGSGWELEDMKKDCSEVGTGVSCSYYYRIGGDFNE